MRRSTPSASPLRPYYCAVIPATLFLSITAMAAPARAQRPQIDARASKLARQIEHSKDKQKRIIVRDFMGPDQQARVLGITLADQLSISLARSAGNGVQVLDRAQIPRALHAAGLERQIAAGPRLSDFVAQGVSASRYESGTLSLESDPIKLSVELDRVGDETKSAWKANASLPLDRDMRQEMDADVLDVPHGRYPLAGTSGSTLPRCIVCHNAPFTDEAVAKRRQGTVFIIGSVGTDGKFTDIGVIKGQPYGLTQSAVETVKTWSFEPSIGPDGNPAPLRQVIEITFHLK
jgi:TonB family protein